MIAKLERRIDNQVAAEVAALGERLRGEIIYFVTGLADALVAVLAEGQGGGGHDPPLAGPKMSPDPLRS